MLPDASCVSRDNEPAGVVEIRPLRNAAPTRAKRIAAAVASQIEPQIKRALLGETPESVAVRFTRKGFADGVIVMVRVAPVRA
jgi:tRNA(Ser,Leu) C12 N-acetylase TAN1